MARIRTIKPEFFTDDAVGGISPLARLLFIGSWVFADDYGTLDRSARQLKAQVFPYDSLDCEALIVELIDAGLLREYEADGKTFLHINGFADHQRIDKPSKAKRPLPSDSRSTPGVLDEPSQSTRSGREGKGKEGKGIGGEPPPGLDLQVWQKWADYRTAIRRPLKPVSIPAAQRELAAFGAEQAAVVEQSVANGWQGLFALKPKSANGKPQERRIETPPTQDQVEAARRKAAADNAALHAKLAGVIGRVA